MINDTGLFQIGHNAWEDALNEWPKSNDARPGGLSAKLSSE